MAVGDAAAAAGMALVSGGEPANTLDTIENQTRDYIAQRTQVPGTPLPIALGGTGADNTSQAVINLNVVAWAYVAPPGQVFAGQIARFSDAGRLQVVDPATEYDVANVHWVEIRLLQRDADILELIDALTARVAALEKKPHP